MKLAIIPARGGSKRIKNKNIIPFLGKPMIAYALEAARESNLFDDIHISTESEEIKKVVEDLGFKVEFMRPKKLADDMTGLLPVIQWVVNKYQNTRRYYSDICCIMPTAPLLVAEDLVNGFELYSNHNKEHPLMVVTSYPVPIEWAYHRSENTLLTPVNFAALDKRSQDIEDTYYEAGPFYFFHSSHITGEMSLNDRKYISYLLPRNRAVDIDNQEDLEFAESLYLGNLAKTEKRG
ncbi:MAG: pseudaminic acid cytidylyltransferase [Desulfobacterales bacterium]|nr:pseudaminic acid cytidylyltransferase [Desulfobacterales bacterium]